MCGLVEAQSGARGTSGGSPCYGVCRADHAAALRLLELSSHTHKYTHIFFLLVAVRLPVRAGAIRSIVGCRLGCQQRSKQF
mmetsp:Transcript_24618/g.56218  ORF Transcript_24618/g.56218 Transcript_24618/m.56218 type:complete len:81 (-) Transcript_24618:92-334(-)